MKIEGFFIMSKRFTREQFILKASQVHDGRYEYSKVEYKTNQVKVCIICPEHGEFWQAPSNHLSGHGCPKCAAKASATKRCKKFADFVSKAKEIHGTKYTYPEQTFANVFAKVTIICPIHGAFEQSVSNHMRGAGCPKCKVDAFAKRRTHTTEDFIAKAQNIHGNRYDYSLVEYKGTHTKVKIVCPEHGIFEQEPNVHIMGSGCPICAVTEAADARRGNLQDFIAKAKKVHGEKYTYDECIYIDSDTKVAIRCPEHGLFHQRPANHLMGNGCPKCGHVAGSEKRSLPLDDFLKRAKNIHGDKYDYSAFVFKNGRAKSIIGCPIHGPFLQSPFVHLIGEGCPKCSIAKRKEKRITPQDDVIKRFRAIHGDKYDYSKVKYVNSHTKVCIICPIHGDFTQTPSSHERGSGCPRCRESIGERKVARWLDKHNIIYLRQFRINPQYHIFGPKRLYVDFYLPDHNIVIEYNGEQHYKRCSIWQSKDDFFNQQERDKILREYCKLHKINLIEIPYTKIKDIDVILKTNIR